MHYFFFFSSRRRHTRLVSDWSSDVCSSDLTVGEWPDRYYPQLEGPPRPPLSVKPDVPESVDAAILALLQPDPLLRPATAAAAMHTLAKALPEEEDGLWPGWVHQLMAS